MNEIKLLNRLPLLPALLIGLILQLVSEIIKCASSFYIFCHENCYSTSHEDTTIVFFIISYSRLYSHLVLDWEVYDMFFVHYVILISYHRQQHQIGITDLFELKREVTLKFYYCTLHNKFIVPKILYIIASLFPIK
jgi:hypothetical protein